MKPFSPETLTERGKSRAFTVATLADAWCCSESSIRNLIRKGELRCFRPGNLIRIAPEEVERFECQNIPSSALGVDMPASGETRQDEDDENDCMPRTALAPRRRPVSDGRSATVLPGRWGES